MTIQFSIWRDQKQNFEAFREREMETVVIITDASGSSYRGWADYIANGPLDELLKFFHLLGKEGYNIHVYRENPVNE